MLSSMSMITEASFWKEQATYRRGWNRSTAYARTSSAETASRSMSGVSRAASPVAPAATATLDRALAFAADYLVGLRAAPVDELVHGLERELDRQRQVADDLLELLLAHAAHEGVEVLAVLAVLLVVADPTLHGLGHALGGQPDFQALAHRNLAALVVAPKVGDVRGDRAL